MFAIFGCFYIIFSTGRGGDCSQSDRLKFAGKLRENCGKMRKIAVFGKRKSKPSQNPAENFSHICGRFSQILIKMKVQGTN
jgi:hypothetical protein